MRSIYIVRYSLEAYYKQRISTAESQLQTLTKERDATIEKLKVATRYDATQQLLDKYGGAGNKKPKAAGAGAGPKTLRRQASGALTGSADRKGKSRPAGPAFALPPTANVRTSLDAAGPSREYIMHPTPAGAPAPPAPQPGLPSSPGSSLSLASPMRGLAVPAGKTFFPSPQYAATSTSLEAGQASHWYDRILDVLLGEDETQARARLALICVQCRLVNGLAPPGARRIVDVGRWRCGGCGAWNGAEAETLLGPGLDTALAAHRTTEGTAESDDSRHQTAPSSHLVEDDAGPLAAQSRRQTKADLTAQSQRQTEAGPTAQSHQQTEAGLTAQSQRQTEAGPTASKASRRRMAAAASNRPVGDEDGEGSGSEVNTTASEEPVGTPDSEADAADAADHSENERETTSTGKESHAATATRRRGKRATKD